jgi:hypothetical protein
MMVMAFLCLYALSLPNNILEILFYNLRLGILKHFMVSSEYLEISRDPFHVLSSFSFINHPSI